MNWRALSILLLIFLTLSSNSCDEGKKGQDEEQLTEEEIRERLIEYNKSKVRTEDKIIDEYSAEHYPEIAKSETGLRYEVYSLGGEKKPESASVCIVRYRIEDLEGDVLYSSDESGPARIQVGHDDVASGLHEGLLYMNEGDSAVFILPSHRAYGFTGDQSKVAQNAILIYHIELIDIK